MREVNTFLFAVAGVVMLLTLAVETPSSKTWWGGLKTASLIAIVALISTILSGQVAWHGLNPWGPVLIFGGPLTGFLWISAQIDADGFVGGAQSPAPDRRGESKSHPAT
jgi:hypothetical protein